MKTKRGQPQRADAATLAKRLHELLGQFGMGTISRESFWNYMNEYGLTDADIDRYCELHARWTPPQNSEEG
jgi:hypothetical protein